MKGMFLYIWSSKEIIIRSRDSSVSIATGWTTGVRLPVGARDFSPLHVFQTGSGARPTSYPMDTGGSIRVGKAAGAWSWNLTSI
jgi:hypothetical protein